MPLKGLTDFQNPVRSEEQGLTIFQSFEDASRFALLPQALEVAERDDGGPDFLLELVRAQNPLLSPKPYGVLDFRLRPTYRMNEALTLLREQNPEAMLEETNFAYGFIRLSASGEVGDAPKELFEPVRLAWNELGVARFILRLPLTGALLLKGALLGEMLPVRAIAEMVVTGVSPRLPINVRFDPERLLGELASLAKFDRQVVWSDLVQFFRRDADTLPLETAGERDNTALDEFAETMADHICSRFARFVPSPKDDALPRFVLQSPGEIGSGRFEWDLSEPISVTRPFVFTFNPLEVARALIHNTDSNRIIRETIVPPIKVGTLPVSISTKLPTQRLGVLSLGVTIKAAPNPPARPQAIIKTVELIPPDDSATVLLQLSPTELPEYTFKTFVILEDEMKRYEGEETLHSGDYLDLQLKDFPLRFVLVEASSDLLDLADIQGVCRNRENDSLFDQLFNLNLNQRSVVIALPKEMSGATLDIEARSKDGNRTLHLGPYPAEPLRLGLTSLREYGPQKIEIECLFANDEKLVAIDLLPEGLQETLTEIKTLHFTPQNPKREWTWFARSPFYPGYRFRLHVREGDEPVAWSEPRSPFERLVINSKILEGSVV